MIVSTTRYIHSEESDGYKARRLSGGLSSPKMAQLFGEPVEHNGLALAKRGGMPRVMLESASWLVCARSFASRAGDNNAAVSDSNALLYSVVYKI